MTEPTDANLNVGKGFGRTTALVPLSEASSNLRQRLLDGSVVAAVIAAVPSEFQIRSDEDLRRSIHRTLEEQAEVDDVYVFAYGSLMWNPALHHTECHRATVKGWHRSFCLTLQFGRGTSSRPGAMLALDEGGSCEGAVLRIAREDVHSELLILWRREMLTGAYEARWVQASVQDREVQALTFVANRHDPSYMANANLSQTADLIATGAGVVGTCAEYFASTVQTLRSIGIHDAGIERLAGELSNRLRIKPPRCD